MGGHLLSLYSATQASRIKRLAATLPFSFKRYKQSKIESEGGLGVEERAPSTAEEFERVAEEKSRKGFPAQTAEKVQDAIAEATVGESSFEPVKESFKEPPAKRRGNET